MLGSGKCSVKLPMQFQNATLCGTISVDDHLRKKISRDQEIIGLLTWCMPMLSAAVAIIFFLELS